MMKLFNWQWFFPLHLYRTNVAAAVIGGAVIGAGASAASSSKAAGAQTDAANQSNETQRMQLAQSRADNLPFMQRGNAAGNALSYRMGLNTSPTGATSGGLTANDLIDTSQGAWQPNANLYSNSPEYKKAWDTWYSDVSSRFGTPGASAAWTTNPAQQEIQDHGFDLNAYNKATQPQIDAAAQADPNYGSLTRKFTTADFNADPVNQLAFKYGMDTGTQGINRQAAATGGLDSGAVLKALTRFGTDYGNTKAGESYNRFTTNQDSTYNKLAGVAGTGQVATQQVSALGANTANNISQNQVGVGNARGASAIAQGNALSGAFTNGYNNYQQNRMVDSYLGRAANNSGYTDGYAAGGRNAWENY